MPYVSCFPPAGGQVICFKMFYQLDFLTPGISPRLASSLKHIRQMPKSLIYPCNRPHLKQRRTMRVENFGFLLALAICDVFAI